MKQLLMAVAVCLTMTACEKATWSDDEEPTNEVVLPDGSVAKTKKFTFTMKGDFSDDWKTTRGYLAADGRDLTDVWVLDYVDGVLQQQLHQDDNTAEDFGKPQMQLAYGSHHVYFIASRGTGATLDTSDKTIVWSKVADTFWKDYEVNVVATSNGNRAVTLDRAVTKLRLTVTDAIAEGAATFNIAPHTWYYGLNYQTGAPVSAQTDGVITINIPANMIGATNTPLNIFGFSSTTEWTTDVTLNCKAGNNDVIGSATIENVPFVRNRVTDYSGPLFGSGGSLTLSLNTDWLDSETGTW
jgi:hypothetical protein